MRPTHHPAAEPSLSLPFVRPTHSRRQPALPGPILPDMTTLDLPDPDRVCAICGGDLWADGLEPARDGTSWICGDCDQARTFTALDPD